MSTSSVVARVYAEAMYEIGVASDTVSELGAELDAVADAIANLDPELRTFIEMPQLPRDDKWQVIRAAFEPQVSRNVLGLLHVLVDRRREAILGDVAFEFGRLVDDDEGRIKAEIVTARPLDDELFDALRAAIERRTRRSVVLKSRVDPDMIGGVRLNLDDQVVDGTTRRALHDMRRTLAGSLA